MHSRLFSSVTKKGLPNVLLGKPLLCLCHNVIRGRGRGRDRGRDRGGKSHHTRCLW